MENPLHTTTLQLACDVEIIVPHNFEQLPIEQKIDIINQNIANQYIKSFEICYPEEVDEIVQGMFG